MESDIKAEPISFSAMESVVKAEPIEVPEITGLATWPLPDRSNPLSVIDLSSSSSTTDSDSDDDSLDGADSSYKRSRASSGGDDEGGSFKKHRFDGLVLPLGFLDPLPPDEDMPLLAPAPISQVPAALPMPLAAAQACKQFWKAGDYEGDPVDDITPVSGGIDHVRVHPKFLHSNATSHKWALGAFAELLDNALDEICNEATYVNIDMLENKKDGSKMLLIEDNGGGMDPDKMRQCVSLGYSAKSKSANTIGQYGNGFKTSTMRLGADVIVFSRCRAKDGKRPTKSIGMLSYTFLRSTRKEDIVVPMVDYEMEGRRWRKLVRSSLDDWNRNAETIIQWSPYSSEEDLLLQVDLIEDQGTRIVIYNLWEDDQGELELDFCADIHDIQLRGVNRDEKKIQMAAQFPNSRHFLTYRHSLRSYASILYLRLPPYFRIILRGKDVEHHNIVNDMMLAQEIMYRPQPSGNAIPKDANMVAVVKIGFVKDAKEHIDIQGFNVYHKNRLIKPFWRVWNAAGSDGRGVIGVLEANFVEPAHDKQGFERTLVLQRLENKLVLMQKQYWSSNCHKIGYAPRRSKKLLDGYSAKDDPLSIQSPDSGHMPDADHSCSSYKRSDNKKANGLLFSRAANRNATSKFGKKIGVSPPSRVRGKSPSEDNVSESDIPCHPHDLPTNGFNVGNASARRTGSSSALHTTSSSENIEREQQHPSGGMNMIVTGVKIKQLEKENHELKESLTKLKELKMIEMQFERDRAKALEAQIREFEQKLEEANKEQEALIDIFSEERNRRDREEENLRKKLKDASDTIQDLLNKASSASYHSNDNNTKIKMER